MEPAGERQGAYHYTPWVGIPLLSLAAVSRPVMPPPSPLFSHFPSKKSLLGSCIPFSDSRGQHLSQPGTEEQCRRTRFGCEVWDLRHPLSWRPLSPGCPEGHPGGTMPVCSVLPWQASSSKGRVFCILLGQEGPKVQAATVDTTQRWVAMWGQGSQSQERHSEVGPARSE